MSLSIQPHGPFLRSIPPLVALCGALFGAACGGAAPPPAQSKGNQSELDALLKKRTALAETLHKAPKDLSSNCELTAGDCLIQVREKRTELAPIGSFGECRPGGDEVSSTRACEDRHLVKSGKLDLLTEYYQFENWCTGKLISCTVELAAAGKVASHQANVARRRKDILASNEAAALSLALEVADARVAYMRTTLPLGLENMCRDASRQSRCQADKKAGEKALEQELEQDDASYQREAALRILTDYRSAEAQCRKAEYDCMLQELEKYGETAPSQVWLEKNMKLIERRQKLEHRVPSDVTARCVSDAVSKYQPMVIDRYQKYVKQPATLSRAQLHAVFVLMHEEQVNCLSSAAS